MKIDIEKLSENELIELNHRIIERLKFLESARAHKKMMKFNIGDKVSFEPSGRKKLTGILVKYNKKTVTIVTDKGERWNVSPHLLSKVYESKPELNKEKGNVIKLKNHNKK